MNLVGLNEINSDSISRQDLLIDCEIGDFLYIDELSSDIDNGHLILSTAAGDNLGCLPTTVAHEISPEFNNGDIFEFFIEGITGDYGELACKVRLVHIT